MEDLANNATLASSRISPGSRPSSLQLEGDGSMLSAASFPRPPTSPALARNPMRTRASPSSRSSPESAGRGLRFFDDSSHKKKFLDSPKSLRYRISNLVIACLAMASVYIIFGRQGLVTKLRDRDTHKATVIPPIPLWKGEESLAEARTARDTFCRFFGNTHITNLKRFAAMDINISKGTNLRKCGAICAKTQECRQAVYDRVMYDCQLFSTMLVMHVPEIRNDLKLSRYDSVVCEKGLEKLPIPTPARSPDHEPEPKFGAVHRGGHVHRNPLVNRNLRIRPLPSKKPEDNNN